MNANPNVSANADTLTAYAELNADADAGVMLATEGFRLLGRALSVIRRDELYRVAGFPSFRAYLNAKTGEWKTAHGKSPSYKHVLNIVTASDWIDAVGRAGLQLEAGSEYEVRQARQLARRLDMADNAVAVVKLTRAVLGANVTNSSVKALTEVMSEYVISGGVTFSDGEQLALNEATLGEIRERTERARLYRMAKWIQLEELIAQLDIATGYEYDISRSPGYDYFDVWQQNDDLGYCSMGKGVTIYDALFDAVKTLYLENGADVE